MTKECKRKRIELYVRITDRDCDEPIEFKWDSHNECLQTQYTGPDPVWPEIELCGYFKRYCQSHIRRAENGSRQEDIAMTKGMMEDECQNWFRWLNREEAREMEARYGRPPEE